MQRDLTAIRIMVIDDEAGFREALARRLERRCALVYTAEDGLEGLFALSQVPVDIVLLDVKMPAMDGLSVLECVRREHSDTEVILITGNANTQEGVDGIKAGAFDYLTKPIKIDYLVSKIGQAYDKLVWNREKKSEAEYRAQMEKQLIVADRLAALGELSAGTAHEINNPLAIINDAAGWLRNRVNKNSAIPAELHHDFNLALEKIESSVKRARRITHQLLSFSRQTDSVVKEFDLSKLVLEVVDLTKKSALENNIDVTAIGSDEEIPIWSDPYQVRQVLLNLVANGLQALQSGGKVDIVISVKENDACIEVRDNGPGIPPENMEKIFEPFFTTKPPGEGTGLGLSVSRGIIEKLGGSIAVESTLGKGTCFKIVIPQKKFKRQ